MGTQPVSSVNPKFMMLFRSALFVGLGSVVATIIYLTPIPDKFPQSCQRRCHELDWPMICRIKFYVEELPCSSGFCVMVNRQTPGPTIQVCENDIIMVDVVNRLSGRSISVHWRGQELKETPHMDGAAMITQCPILSYTTFQYKFRASQPGSHMWQVNPISGLDSEDLFGAFIVKQSDTREKQRYLYDTDQRQHIILITASQKNIKPSQTEYNITAGVRHRWRLIYGGQPSQCRVAISLDNLPVTLIALDGHPVKPLVTSSVEIAFGERIDVVVEAPELNELRHLHLEPVGCDDVTPSQVLVHVIKAKLNSPSANNILTHSNPPISTTADADCDKDTVCLMDVDNVDDIPQQLNASQLDNKIILMFGIRPIPPDYNASVIAPGDGNYWGSPHINNITMLLPSSPLMTQMEDIEPSTLCDSSCSGHLCECLHVLHIPNGETVELLLIHQGGGGPNHVFHLHGNSFYVVGTTQLNKALSAEEIINLEKQDQLVIRNLTNPVLKDSISVPQYGVVALRFLANNPGFWLLDQELSLHGMQVILHVGSTSDIPETPKNYPRCGSWVGPEFFLT